MNQNRNDWILCSSKRMPGKHYYFNVRSNESFWVEDDEISNKNPVSFQGSFKDVYPGPGPFYQFPDDNQMFKNMNLNNVPNFPKSVQVQTPMAPKTSVDAAEPKILEFPVHSSLTPLTRRFKNYVEPRLNRYYIQKNAADFFITISHMETSNMMNLEKEVTNKISILQTDQTMQTQNTVPMGTNCRSDTFSSSKNLMNAYMQQPRHPENKGVTADKESTQIPQSNVNTTKYLQNISDTAEPKSVSISELSQTSNPNEELANQDKNRNPKTHNGLVTSTTQTDAKEPKILNGQTLSIFDPDNCNQDLRISSSAGGLRNQALVAPILRERVRAGYSSQSIKDLRLLLNAKKGYISQLSEETANTEQGKNCKDGYAPPRKKVKFQSTSSNSDDRPLGEVQEIGNHKNTESEVRRLGTEHNRPTRRYILVDTDILFENFALIQDFVTQFDESRLFIPRCVSEFIESILLGDSRGRQHVGVARSINRLTRSPSTYVEVQSAEVMDEDFDDTGSLLDCCIHLKRQGSCVVLITNDVSVHKLAKRHQVLCLSLNDVTKLVKDGTSDLGLDMHTVDIDNIPNNEQNLMFEDSDGIDALPYEQQIDIQEDVNNLNKAPPAASDRKKIVLDKQRTDIKISISNDRFGKKQNMTNKDQDAIKGQADLSNKTQKSVENKRDMIDKIHLIGKKEHRINEQEDLIDDEQGSIDEDDTGKEKEAFDENRDLCNIKVSNNKEVLIDNGKNMINLRQEVIDSKVVNNDEESSALTTFFQKELIPNNILFSKTNNIEKYIKSKKLPNTNETKNNFDIYNTIDKIQDVKDLNSHKVARLSLKRKSNTIAPINSLSNTKKSRIIDKNYGKVKNLYNSNFSLINNNEIIATNDVTLSNKESPSNPQIDENVENLDASKYTPKSKVNDVHDMKNGVKLKYKNVPKSSYKVCKNLENIDVSKTSRDGKENNESQRFIQSPNKPKLDNVEKLDASKFSLKSKVNEVDDMKNGVKLKNQNVPKSSSIVAKNLDVSKMSRDGKKNNESQKSLPSPNKSKIDNVEKLDASKFSPKIKVNEVDDMKNGDKLKSQNVPKSSSKVSKNLDVSKMSRDGKENNESQRFIQSPNKPKLDNVEKLDASKFSLKSKVSEVDDMKNSDKLKTKNFAISASKADKYVVKYDVSKTSRDKKENNEIIPLNGYEIVKNVDSKDNLDLPKFKFSFVQKCNDLVNDWLDGYSDIKKSGCIIKVEENVANIDESKKIINNESKNDFLIVKQENNVDMPIIYHITPTSADVELASKYRIKTFSLDEHLMRFNIKSDDIDERISTRIGEWLCTLSQIMEDVLVHVLRDMRHMKKIGHIGNLKEYLKCLLTKYSKDGKLKMITNRMLKFLHEKRYDNGKLKGSIRSSEFLTMMGCSVLLIEHLKKVHWDMPQFADAEQSLATLQHALESDDDVSTISPCKKAEADRSAEVRTNFIKQASYINEYVEKHFKHLNQEPLENENKRTKKGVSKVVQTKGRNLNTLKITNNKCMTLEHNAGHKTSCNVTQNDNPNISIISNKKFQMSSSSDSD